MAGLDHAGVIDQHVEPAFAGHDVGDEGLPALLVAHVLAHEARGGTDLTRHALAVFDIDVGEDEPRPLRRHQAGVGLAEPLGRAGDDRDLAVKSAHERVA